LGFPSQLSNVHLKTYTNRDPICVNCVEMLFKNPEQACKIKLRSCLPLPKACSVTKPHDGIVDISWHTPNATRLIRAQLLFLSLSPSPPTNTINRMDHINGTESLRSASIYGQSDLFATISFLRPTPTPSVSRRVAMFGTRDSSHHNTTMLELFGTVMDCT